MLRQFPLVLKNKSRSEVMRAAALVGSVVCAAMFPIVPELRRLFESFGGLVFAAYCFASFALFFVVLADATQKNYKWIARTLRWRVDEDLVSVVLPPVPVAPGLRLLLGEQHKQDGHRIAHPSWFALSGDGLYTGILVVGDSGSGKTTCAGYTWIEEMLAKGLGGLILDAGGSYVRFAQRQMAALDRSADLVVIEPGGEWKCNPIQKPEMSSTDLAGWIFMIIRNLAGAAQTSGTEAFWIDKGQEYAAAVIELCRLVDPTHITLQILYRLNSDEETRQKILSGLEGEVRNGTTPERLHRIQEALNFWRKSVPQMGPNLRGSIPAQFDAVVSMFAANYQLFETFCPHPDEDRIFPGFTNDVLDSGKVIVVNMPLQKYPRAGRVISTMLKLDFQASVKRRTEGKSEADVKQPVFLLIDEAQNYVSARGDVGDPLYLAESRKNKAVNVYMSQSIDSFKDAFRDEPSCNVFFNNLRTKVFLSQEGHESQRICAELCGKSTQYKKTLTEAEAGRNTGIQYLAGGFVHEEVAISKTVAYSEHDEYIFKPHDFRNLPQFVSIVSPYDGNAKLLPRVVYMKPIFVDSEGNVSSRVCDTWFSADRAQLMSYGEVLTNEIRVTGEEAKGNAARAS